MSILSVFFEITIGNYYKTSGKLRIKLYAELILYAFLLKTKPKADKIR